MGRQGGVCADELRGVGAGRVEGEWDGVVTVSGVSFGAFAGEG